MSHGVTSIEDKQEAFEERRDSTPFFTELGIQRRTDCTAGVLQLQQANKQHFIKTQRDCARNIFGDEIVMDDFEENITTSIITTENYVAKPIACNNESDGSESSGHSMFRLCNIPNIEYAKSLQNALKLAPSHRWMVCEFFYSFIDAAIFGCWNNYEQILLERFPATKERKLTKHENRILRRFLGRPGRMSSVFMMEERVELERKRRIIRFLQQHQYEDVKSIDLFYNMPSELPTILPNGTRVITKLELSSVGITSGVIVSHDAKNYTYMVKLESAELGKRHIPDFSIYEPSNTKTFSLANTLDRIMGAKTGMDTSEQPTNRHPKELLQALVRLENLTDIKCAKVQRIHSMNNDFERQLTKDQKMPKPKEREQFQKQYVTLMVTLHRLNADILEPLKTMHEYYHAHGDDDDDIMQLQRHELIRHCQETAEFAFRREGGHKRVKCEKVAQLIKNIHTMLTLASYMDHDNMASIEEALDVYVEQIAAELPTSAKAIFDSAILALFQPLREHVRTMNERIRKNYHLRHYTAISSNLSTEDVTESLQ